MSRRDRAPAPFDIEIDDVGYACPRSGGAPRTSETTPVDQMDPKRGEDSLVLEDWYAGTGLRVYTADPQSRHMLYYAISDDLDGPAGDTTGGGVDGSYGPLLPGPLMNDETVDSDGGTVRHLVAFEDYTGTTGYYAAIDNGVWRSTSQDMSSATAVLALPTGAKVRKLVAFTGTNGLPRLYALSENAQIYSTIDGTTWTGIGNDARDPQAALVTSDSGANYTDYTSNVSASGVMTLDSLDTKANGDWVLLGLDVPFIGIGITLTDKNANAATLAAEYFGPDGWTALTVSSDTTESPAGTSLGQDGNVLWARPGGAWLPAPLTELGADGDGPTLTKALFWVRLSWSAALDSAVSIDTISLDSHAEGVTGAVLGDQFAIVGADNRTIMTCRDGGVTPTFLATIDSLEAGRVLDMEAAADTWWVYADTHISAVGADGTVRPYFPELFRQPVPSTDGLAFAAWLGHLYPSRLGGFYQLDPTTGAVDVIGPERQFLNDDAVAPQVTAAVGDRTHALYAAWKTPGGRAWLAKWGGYRLGQSPSGLPEYDRVDAWHMLGDLGSDRTITGMAIWYSGTQPYLALGGDDGTVVTCALPKGSSPLEADSGYRWSTRQVSLFFPVWRGSDPSRKVEAYAATLVARNLTATRTIALETRDYTAGGSFTTQLTRSDDTTARQAFATPYSGYGLEVSLTLKMTSDSTTPWILDGLRIHQQQAFLDSQNFFSVDVLADDDVVLADGRIVPKTADDWITAIDATMAKTTPVTLVRSNGSSEKVLPRGRSDGELRPDAWGSRKQSYRLSFASAEGAPS